MRMNRKSANEQGITLIELMVAVLVLMVGVVAVAQIVPLAMRSNVANRYDSTSVVIAQRMMDLLASQPVSVFIANNVDPFEPTLTIVQAGPGPNTIPTVVIGNSFPPGGLGPGVISGPNWGPGVGYITNIDTINWTAAAVPGYSATVIDPTSPNQAAYQIRWAVDTRWGLVSGTVMTPVMKRIVVSVRRLDPSSTFVTPTSLTVVRTNGVM